MGGAGMGRSRYFGSTSFWLSREIHGRLPRVLWPSNGCSKHCTLDSVELKGLQLRDSIACSALWLSHAAKIARLWQWLQIYCSGDFQTLLSGPEPRSF